MEFPGPNNNGIAVLSSAFASSMAIGVFLNAIFLSLLNNTHCVYSLYITLIILSSFLMAHSILIGTYGAYTGFEWILRYYLRTLFILMIFMYAITIFTISVTVRSPGVAVPGQGYMVGNHHSWLKTRVNDDWNKITSFIQQNKICDHNHNGTIIIHANLSSIQSNCCNLSNDCSNSSSTNPDCTKWSSDEKVLCYGCESCKIAWANSIRPILTRVAGIDSALLVLVVIGNIVLYQNVHVPERTPRVPRNETPSVPTSVPTNEG
ncbi:tetraspanin-8-like [Impatiens glandulifera]|uniref:tetraspanin-8-like n=1 Tax=Impatiens glandulifera TaxID=253017 RepID=UPI001FB1905A|nr:tetraspanin-8-like [Impatiens glandulifera]